MPTPDKPRVPRLLRGAEEIGQFLGMSPGAVQHRHREGSIPTFRVGGTPYATPAALSDWIALHRAGKLPVQ